MSAYLILAEYEDGRKMLINPIGIIDIADITIIPWYDTSAGFFDWMEDTDFRMHYFERTSHASFAMTTKAIKCLVRMQKEYYKAFSNVNEGKCKLKIISYQNGIKLLSKSPSRLERLRYIHKNNLYPRERCNTGFGDYLRDVRYSKRMIRKRNKQKARKGKFR